METTSQKKKKPIIIRDGNESYIYSPGVNATPPGHDVNIRKLMADPPVPRKTTKQ